MCSSLLSTHWTWPEGAGRVRLLHQFGKSSYKHSSSAKIQRRNSTDQQRYSYFLGLLLHFQHLPVVAEACRAATRHFVWRAMILTSLLIIDWVQNKNWTPFVMPISAGYVGSLHFRSDWVKLQPIFSSPLQSQWATSKWMYLSSYWNLSCVQLPGGAATLEASRMCTDLMRS